MHKKNILFIINKLNGGGAEKVVLNLMENYVKLGYNVDIITFYRENKKHRFKGVNIYNIGISPKLKFLIFPIVIKKFNDIVLKLEKEKHYSLITSHLNFSDFIVSKSIISQKAIYVIHNNYIKEKNLLVKLMFNHIYSNKFLSVVSDGIKESIIKNFSFNKDKIIRIYNPVSKELLLKKSLSQIENSELFLKPYFIFVGRIEDKQKRVDRILEVFYKGNFYLNYNLVFCGNGSEIENLKKKSVLYGIENKVHFLGFKDNVYKYIKNADILILSSDYEGLPMVIVESLILGTKVISSDCDFGPREIMTGDFKKYLVEDVSSVDEYISKINLAINNYPDNFNNSKFDVNNICREYILKYSWFFGGKFD